jgi:hypothetical protein
MAEPWEMNWSTPQAPAGGSGMPWEQDWNAAPAAPPMSTGEKAMDAIKSLGTETLKGTLALGGMVGDLTNLGAKGIEKASNAVSDALGTERYQRPETPSALDAIPTTASLSKSLTDALGEDFYKPKSEWGKAAGAVGSFLPGAALTAATGGGSLASNVARYAIAPGAATFAAEKYLPESDYKTYLVAGAGVGASLANPARIVTPLPATAAKQAAVAALENEGVTSLTAGQRTGNKSLQYLESAASHAPGAGHGAANVEAEGQRQFTEAVLRRAGAAGEATPEVLGANQRRLGQTFEDLSTRNNLVPDNHFVNDVVDAARNYRRVPDSQQRQMVQGYIDDIIDHVNNGHMPGPQYQEMRSRLSRESNGLRVSDPTLSQALRDLRNGLDNAMSRSIAPADQQAWQTARREYSAQKVIEKAASRAGEATAEGQITPANLRNTLPKAGGGYARGEGDFNELARSGVSVMTPLPNSGTAQRTNAFHLLNAGLLGIPQAAAGRVVMSRPVQDILANQLMAGSMPANPAARRLLMAEMLQRAGNQSGITIRPVQQPSAETQ